MIFSRKHAGKWVASRGERVVATGPKLAALMKKVSSRKDRDAIRFDLVPPHPFFAGRRGVPLR